MPYCEDFRTKHPDELTFYVYDNLRGNAMGAEKETIYRYDTLDEAINKFRELPDDWTSAIGCSFGGIHEIDLVHRVNGEAVKIMDFYNIDDFKKREDVHDVMKTLVNKLDIQYQLVFGIHPRRSVMTPLESPDYMDPYFTDKVLMIPYESRSVHLFASINEVYEEGKGWVSFRDFVASHPDDAYLSPVAPVVSKVNANYKVIGKKAAGQADMSPICFNNMIKKTKEYNLSMEKGEESIIQRSEKAEMKRENQGYEIINSMVLQNAYGNSVEIMMGHNAKAAEPFVTWEGLPGKEDSFSWGHYFVSKEAAMQDFFERGMKAVALDLRRVYRNELAAIDIGTALEQNFSLKQVEKFLNTPSFMDRAMHIYYNVDHSAENEYLADALERLYRENDWELADRKPSLSERTENAQRSLKEGDGGLHINDKRNMER